MLTAILVVDRLRLRVDAVGLLARAHLPRRGHPHAGQRQHRRDERVARPRAQARGRRGVPRHAEGLRAGVRRDEARRPRRGRARRRAPRCSATSGRSSWGSRRGGKVVATTGGAFLGVAPIVGGIGAGVWLLVFGLTRYASVASIVSALTLPLWAWLVGYPWPVIAFAGVAGAAVLVLHRANIGRLVRGEEPRFVRRWSGRPLAPQPVSELGVPQRAVRAARELGAQLADRAVALGDDLVRVDRLEVQLAREDEVARRRDRGARRAGSSARRAPSPRRSAAADAHARRRRARPGRFSSS